MRTTVTLDADAESLLRRAMADRGISFEQAHNDAIRGARGPCLRTSSSSSSSPASRKAPSRFTVGTPVLRTWVRKEIAGRRTNGWRCVRRRATRSRRGDGVAVVHPGPHRAEILNRLLGEVGTGGNLVDDAHLAALAVEQRASIVSYDTDLTRFGSVRSYRPEDLVAG